MATTTLGNNAVGGDNTIGLQVYGWLGVAPVSGEVKTVNAYFGGDASNSGLALYLGDAQGDDPDALIADSDTGRVYSPLGPGWLSHTYIGTRPVVEAGQNIWCLAYRETGSDITIKTGTNASSFRRTAVGAAVAPDPASAGSDAALWWPSMYIEIETTTVGGIARRLGISVGIGV